MLRIDQKHSWRWGQYSRATTTCWLKPPFALGQYSRTTIAYDSKKQKQVTERYTCLKLTILESNHDDVRPYDTGIAKGQRKQNLAPHLIIVRVSRMHSTLHLQSTRVYILKEIPRATLYPSPHSNQTNHDCSNNNHRTVAVRLGEGGRAGPGRVRPGQSVRVRPLARKATNKRRGAVCTYVHVYA